MGQIKNLKIWDSTTWLIKRTLNGLEGYVHSLAELRNGDIAGGSTTEITIWDRITGSFKVTLSEHKSFVLALAVLHNGDLASQAILI